MLRLGLSLLLLGLWRPLPWVAVGESSVFLPAPENLTIESYNFENILRWSPVMAINGTVSYRVEYRLQSDKESDEHWEEVKCTNIAKPECNFDHGKDFYRNLLRVRAEQGELKSNWSQAHPFQAKKDTILRPPRAINVTSEGNSLILRFLPPLAHKGDTFVFNYVIYFWEESVKREASTRLYRNTTETKNTEKKFKNLKKMTVYCFQVQAVYKENRGQISDPHCKKTTTESTNFCIILVFGIICIGILSVLCLWIFQKYKNTIKSFCQPPLRIPSHYEEDLQNAAEVMEYTFKNCAIEEQWDIVSIISSTSQSQTLRDSFASGNQADVSKLKEHR